MNGSVRQFHSGRALATLVGTMLDPIGKIIGASCPPKVSRVAAERISARVCGVIGRRWWVPVRKRTDEAIDLHFSPSAISPESDVWVTVGVEAKGPPKAFVGTIPWRDVGCEGGGFTIPRGARLDGWMRRMFAEVSHSSLPDEWLWSEAVRTLARPAASLLIPA